MLNSSGVIYLKFIITHFEYFSAFQAYVDINSEYKPLFLSLGIDHKKNKSVFEFEEIIDHVFTIVKRFKENMDNYFINEMKPKLGISEDEFISSKSKLSFSKSYLDKKSFYSSRIIFTHIEYLENFRFYLWTNDEFNKQLNDLNTTYPTLINKIQIQKFIIDKIEEYLMLFKTGIIDQNSKAIASSLEKKVRLLKDPLYAFTEWIWIRIANTEN
jgi:hypothetical protein